MKGYEVFKVQLLIARCNSLLMKYVIKITQKRTKQIKNHELNKKIKSTSMKKTGRLYFVFKLMCNALFYIRYVIIEIFIIKKVYMI